MPYSSSAPLPQEDRESGHGWLVLGDTANACAVRSDWVAAVFRCSEASDAYFRNPAAHVQIHGGRPWFIVTFEKMFAASWMSHGDTPKQWTVALSGSSPVAVQVASIEGPYKGVVIDGMLKTPSGDWPVVSPHPGLQ